MSITTPQFIKVIKDNELVNRCEVCRKKYKTQLNDMRAYLGDEYFSTGIKSEEEWKQGAEIWIGYNNYHLGIDLYASGEGKERIVAEWQAVIDILEQLNKQRSKILSIKKYETQLNDMRAYLGDEYFSTGIKSEEEWEKGTEICIGYNNYHLGIDLYASGEGKERIVAEWQAVIDILKQFYDLRNSLYNECVDINRQKVTS